MQKRRRIKQSDTLEARLNKLASNLRKRAENLGPGVRREELLVRAQQYEDSAHVSKWLRPNEQSHA